MSRRLAPRWAAWELSGMPASVPAPSGVGVTSPPPGGTPILTKQFPLGAATQLQLFVEIAFGTDRSMDSSNWTWTDVTDDVLMGDSHGIDITTGKQDERSTAGPAQMQLTLKNMANKYGQSPFGQYWPNVKRGTPVRCRVWYQGMYTTLFFGYASTWAPTFDPTGRYAIVQLTANGILRQLQQGTNPVQSTLRIYTPNVAGLVAYWPMEDDSASTVFVAATPGTGPMTYASANLASNSTAVGSAALPTLNGGTWCTVPAYAPTGAVQFRFLGVFPAAANALPDLTPIVRCFTGSGSTIAWTDITYGVGGSLRVTAHSAYDGSVVYDSGPIAYAVDGKVNQVNLSMATSGSNVTGVLSIYTQYSSAAAYTNFTITGQTIGGAAFVQFLPVTSTTQLAVGHLTVQSQVTDVFETVQPVNAYDGETVYYRYQRLLPLAGAEARGALWNYSQWTHMGPQKPDTVLNLIRETEQTDPGIVIDGHDASITALSHDILENMPVALTIDAQQSQVMPTVTPIDDDQRLRNQWTLTQRDGSAVTESDYTGDNGINRVGLYSDSATINVTQNVGGTQSGAQGVKAAQDRANWLVHLGTVSGYRYPTLQLAFHHNPELLASWLSIWNTVYAGNFGYSPRSGVGLGVARIQLLNLGKVYPTVPDETLDLMVIGVSYHITKFMWTAAPNLGSYEPYKVGVLGQPSGDTSEFVMRLDTSGSTLAAEAIAGSTSLSVATNTGPIWTTRSDDFPLSIRVGGIKVTVTNITGATSPQTFTVDPTTVTKELTVGGDVKLWNPPALALGGTS